MSEKVYMDKNVYDAAVERIAVAFQNFDNVLVAFSGGKDSGICVNLCYQYAQEHGMLYKMAIYHEDYEAGYPQMFEYIERVFEAMPDVRRYWLCLPISAECSASMHQTRWIPWNPSERDIWVRTPPEREYVYTIDRLWFDFEIGTSGFDFRIQFAKEYSKMYGTTAVIVGLRSDESLARLGTISSQHRRYMFRGLRYTKTGAAGICNFYPIYDWATEDVWTAYGKFKWDYNRLYDLYYKAGLSIHEMRTASPFHHAGQNNLKLFRVIAPDMWGRMISRVNGVNFTAIYGGTSAMGWRNIKKPSHFTWKQYAEFLAGTLPEETRANLLYHLDRLKISWNTVGYGRNPDVIRTMEEEGIELEKTGEISKLCTKDNIYEIVKITGEFPDETSLSDFRHCPNWKDVCIAIMKNDFALQTLGVSPSKDQQARINAIRRKYKAIMGGADL